MNTQALPQPQTSLQPRRPGRSIGPWLVTALLFMLASLPVGMRLADPDAAALEDAEAAAEVETSESPGPIAAEPGEAEERKELSEEHEEHEGDGDGEAGEVNEGG